MARLVLLHICSNFQVMTGIHFETLGCRLNQIESESAARAFSDEGFLVSMEPFTASSAVREDILLCIVNTCTVTSKAEQKARRMIRLLLQKCPLSAVIVTGCYAQLAPAAIAAIDSRIAVLPGLQKNRLADVPLLLHNYTDSTSLPFNCQGFAESVRNSLCHISSVLSVPERPFRLLTDTFLTHSRSSIKIQDGCNNACTYCCIHLARGHSVSLDVQSVLDRVRELERAGQKEVVFTAVNIAQYRGEWHGRFIPFSGLLQILLDGTEGVFFRMSSLYPEIVDEQLCRIISDQRVRPHFHLSVQSGSDSVLHAMQRPYTVSQVRKAVQLLRTVKENPFIACDIIAGFPGETSGDFEQTMQLCRDSSFSWIHAFPFSPRPGTPAYTMRPAVPQSEAGKRVARLTELACDNKIAYINSFAGKIRSAVAETVHHPLVTAPQHDFIVHAVTDNFLHCELHTAPDKRPQPGALINVTIEKAFDQRIRSGSEWEASACLA